MCIYFSLSAPLCHYHNVIKGLHLRRYCVTAHYNGFELSSYSGLELTAASLLGGPTFPWKPPGRVTIRSTPINPSACDLYLRDFERMPGLPSQNARILRRSSFGAARLNSLLICYPYYEHSELVQGSGLQRAGLESMVNCIFYEL